MMRLLSPLLNISLLYHSMSKSTHPSHPQPYLNPSTLTRTREEKTNAYKLTQRCSLLNATIRGYRYCRHNYTNTVSLSPSFATRRGRKYPQYAHIIDICWPRNKGRSGAAELDKHAAHCSHHVGHGQPSSRTIGGQDGVFTDTCRGDVRRTWTMQLDTLTMWNTAGWVTSFWDRQLVMRVYI